jgi:hypothetical protein
MGHPHDGVALDKLSPCHRQTGRLFDNRAGIMIGAHTARSCLNNHVEHLPVRIPDLPQD